MIRNLITWILLTLILAGCSGFHLSEKSAERIAPYDNPHHFRFYGMQFGEKPRNGMYKVVQDVNLPGTEVYRMAKDPVEQKFFPHTQPTFYYAYYNGHLVKILAKLNDQICYTFSLIDYQLSMYRASLLSMYGLKSLFEVYGPIGGDSIKDAEQEIITRVSALEKSDIKWGYLFHPNNLARDIKAIKANTLIGSDVAMNIMPHIWTSDIRFLQQWYQLQNRESGHLRLRTMFNGNTAALYFNKHTRIDLNCGAQQSIAFSHFPTVEKYERIKRNAKLGL